MNRSPSVVCGLCGCVILKYGERAPRGVTRKTLQRMHVISCSKARESEKKIRRFASVTIQDEIGWLRRALTGQGQ